jgi:hypothetical protein
VNPGAANGERRLAVREAAAAWQSAGLIGEPARAAIDAAYADDRQRVGTALRVLLFVFGWIAGQSASGFFMLFGEGRGLGVISLVFGVLFAVASEALRNQGRRAQSGAEEAAGLLAVSYLIGGVGWVLMRSLSDDQRSIHILFGLTAALALAAAWRWGGAIYGGAAAAGALFALAPFPAVRWTWLGLAAVLALPLIRLGESERLAPTQRRAAWAALAVLLAAAYTAVHLGLWDLHALEELSGALGAGREVTMPRIVAIVGTALLPLALLALGIAGRRRLLVDLGLLCGLVSLITAIVYRDWRPAWLVLAAGGLAFIGLALVLRKALDAAPGKEWRGWTAEPLFENPDRRSLVELAASLAVLSPQARQQPEAPGFAGGGGEMGGGGSSSSF